MQHLSDILGDKKKTGVLGENKFCFYLEPTCNTIPHIFDSHALCHNKSRYIYIYICVMCLGFMVYVPSRAALAQRSSLNAFKLQSDWWRHLEIQNVTPIINIRFHLAGIIIPLLLHQKGFSYIFISGPLVFRSMCHTCMYACMVDWMEELESPVKSQLQSRGPFDICLIIKCHVIYKLSSLFREFLTCTSML